MVRNSPRSSISPRSCAITRMITSRAVSSCRLPSTSCGRRHTMMRPPGLLQPLAAKMMRRQRLHFSSSLAAQTHANQLRLRSDASIERLSVHLVVHLETPDHLETHDRQRAAREPRGASCACAQRVRMMRSAAIAAHALSLAAASRAQTQAKSASATSSLLAPTSGKTPRSPPLRASRCVAVCSR